MDKLAILISNPADPTIKDHQLRGKKSSFRAFSVTGDVRVTYKKINSSTIELYDIGTHNQVYD